MAADTQRTRVSTRRVKQTNDKQIWQTLPSTAVSQQFVQRFTGQTATDVANMARDTLVAEARGRFAEAKRFWRKLAEGSRKKRGRFTSKKPWPLTGVPTEFF